MKQIAASHADKWSAEDGTVVMTSGGLSFEWTNRKYKADGLWAYLPVKKPALQETGSAAIDALIAKRQPTCVTPAATADWMNS